MAPKDTNQEDATLGLYAEITIDKSSVNDITEETVSVISKTFSGISSAIEKGLESVTAQTNTSLERLRSQLLQHSNVINRTSTDVQVMLSTGGVPTTNSIDGRLTDFTAKLGQLNISIANFMSALPKQNLASLSNKEVVDLVGNNKTMLELLSTLQKAAPAMLEASSKSRETKTELDPLFNQVKNLTISIAELQRNLRDIPVTLAKNRVSEALQPLQKVNLHYEVSSSELKSIIDRILNSTSDTVTTAHKQLLTSLMGQYGKNLQEVLVRFTNELAIETLNVTKNIGAELTTCFKTADKLLNSMGTIALGVSARGDVVAGSNYRLRYYDEDALRARNSDIDTVLKAIHTTKADSPTTTTVTTQEVLARSIDAQTKEFTKCLRNELAAIGKERNAVFNDSYELCKACGGGNKYHGETTVLTEMQRRQIPIEGSTMVVGGHYVSCDGCQKAMQQLGVANAVALQNPYKPLDSSEKWTSQGYIINKQQVELAELVKKIESLQNTNAFEILVKVPEQGLQQLLALKHELDTRKTGELKITLDNSGLNLSNFKPTDYFANVKWNPYGPLGPMGGGVPTWMRQQLSTEPLKLIKNSGLNITELESGVLPYLDKGTVNTTDIKNSSMVMSEFVDMLDTTIGEFKYLSKSVQPLIAPVRQEMAKIKLLSGKNIKDNIFSTDQLHYEMTGGSITSNVNGEEDAAYLQSVHNLILQAQDLLEAEKALKLLPKNTKPAILDERNKYIDYLKSDVHATRTALGMSKSELDNLVTALDTEDAAIEELIINAVGSKQNSRNTAVIEKMPILGKNDTTLQAGTDLAIGLDTFALAYKRLIALEKNAKRIVKRNLPVSPDVLSKELDNYIAIYNSLAAVMGLFDKSVRALQSQGSIESSLLFNTELSNAVETFLSLFDNKKLLNFTTRAIPKTLEYKPKGMTTLDEITKQYPDGKKYNDVKQLIRNAQVIAGEQNLVTFDIETGADNSILSASILGGRINALLTHNEQPTISSPWHAENVAMDAYRPKRLAESRGAELTRTKTYVQFLIELTDKLYKAQQGLQLAHYAGSDVDVLQAEVAKQLSNPGLSQDTETLKKLESSIEQLRAIKSKPILDIYKDVEKIFEQIEPGSLYNTKGLKGLEGLKPLLAILEPEIMKLVNHINIDDNALAILVRKLFTMPNAALNMFVNPSTLSGPTEKRTIRPEFQNMLDTMLASPKYQYAQLYEKSTKLREDDPTKLQVEQDIVKLYNKHIEVQEIFKNTDQIGKILDSISFIKSKFDPTKGFLNPGVSLNAADFSNAKASNRPVEALVDSLAEGLSKIKGVRTISKGGLLSEEVALTKHEMISVIESRLGNNESLKSLIAVLPSKTGVITGREEAELVGRLVKDVLEIGLSKSLEIYKNLIYKSLIEYTGSTNLGGFNSPTAMVDLINKRLAEKQYGSADISKIITAKKDTIGDKISESGSLHGASVDRFKEFMSIVQPTSLIAETKALAAFEAFTTAITKDDFNAFKKAFESVGKKFLIFEEAKKLFDDFKKVITEISMANAVGGESTEITTSLRIANMPQFSVSGKNKFASGGKDLGGGIGILYTGYEESGQKALPVMARPDQIIFDALSKLLFLADTKSRFNARDAFEVAADEKLKTQMTLYAGAGLPTAILHSKGQELSLAPFKVIGDLKTAILEILQTIHTSMGGGKLTGYNMQIFGDLEATTQSMLNKYAKSSNTVALDAKGLIESSKIRQWSYAPTVGAVETNKMVEDLLALMFKKEGFQPGVSNVFRFGAFSPVQTKTLLAQTTAFEDVQANNYNRDSVDALKSLHASMQLIEPGLKLSELTHGLVGITTGGEANPSSTTAIIRLTEVIEQFRAELVKKTNLPEVFNMNASDAMRHLADNTIKWNPYGPLGPMGSGMGSLRNILSIGASQLTNTIPAAELQASVEEELKRDAISKKALQEIRNKQSKQSTQTVIEATISTESSKGSSGGVPPIDLPPIGGNTGGHIPGGQGPSNLINEHPSGAMEYRIAAGSLGIEGELRGTSLELVTAKAKAANDEVKRLVGLMAATTNAIFLDDAEQDLLNFSIGLRKAGAGLEMLKEAQENLSRANKNIAKLDADEQALIKKLAQYDAAGIENLNSTEKDDRKAVKDRLLDTQTRATLERERQARAQGILDEGVAKLNIPEDISPRQFFSNLIRRGETLSNNIAATQRLDLYKEHLDTLTQSIGPVKVGAQNLTSVATARANGVDTISNVQEIQAYTGFVKELEKEFITLASVKSKIPENSFIKENEDIKKNIELVKLLEKDSADIKGRIAVESKTITNLTGMNKSGAYTEDIEKAKEVKAKLEEILNLNDTTIEASLQAIQTGLKNIAISAEQASKGLVAAFKADHFNAITQRLKVIQDELNLFQAKSKAGVATPVDRLNAAKLQFEDATLNAKLSKTNGIPQVDINSLVTTTLEQEFSSRDALRGNLNSRAAGYEQSLIQSRLTEKFGPSTSNLFNSLMSDYSGTLSRSNLGLMPRNKVTNQADLVEQKLTDLRDLETRLQDAKNNKNQELVVALKVDWRLRKKELDDSLKDLKIYLDEEFDKSLTSTARAKANKSELAAQLKPLVDRQKTLVADISSGFNSPEKTAELSKINLDIASITGKKYAQTLLASLTPVKNPLSQLHIEEWLGTNTSIQPSSVSRYDMTKNAASGLLRSIASIESEGLPKTKTDALFTDIAQKIANITALEQKLETFKNSSNLSPAQARKKQGLEDALATEKSDLLNKATGIDKALADAKATDLLPANVSDRVAKAAKDLKESLESEKDLLVAEEKLGLLTTQRAQRLNEINRALQQTTGRTSQEIEREFNQQYRERNPIAHAGALAYAKGVSEFTGLQEIGINFKTDTTNIALKALESLVGEFSKLESVSKGLNVTGLDNAFKALQKNFDAAKYYEQELERIDKLLKETPTADHKTILADKQHYLDLLNKEHALNAQLIADVKDQIKIQRDADYAPGKREEAARKSSEKILNDNIYTEKDVRAEIAAGMNIEANIKRLRELEKQNVKLTEAKANPLTATGTAEELAKLHQVDLGSGRRGAAGFVEQIANMGTWWAEWTLGQNIMVAIPQALSSGTAFAKEFEAQMKNVELITQANKIQFEQLVGVIGSLSSTRIFSPKDLAEGLIILGQAGFNAVESLKLLPAITDLATATLSNLKVAADIATTAIEAFNIPIDKAGELTNTLAAITIESKLEINSLGTTFNYIAESAAGAGLSIEQIGTAMGIMSNAGVRASTIGTSLRSVIGTLMAPTAKFVTELGKIGMSTEDVNPRYRELGTILTELHDKGFDVQKAFEGLDKRIAGAITSLITNAGEYQSFIGRISGTERATTMAEGQMDTFDAQAKRLQHGLQLLGVETFGPSLAPAKVFASSLASIVETLTSLTGLIPANVRSIIGMSAALGLASAAVKTLYDGFKMLFSANTLKGAMSNAWALVSDKNVFRPAQPATLFAPAIPGGALANVEGVKKQFLELIQMFISPQMLGGALALGVGAAALYATKRVISGESKVEETRHIADSTATYASELSTLEKILQKTNSTTVLYHNTLKKLREEYGILSIEQLKLEANNARVVARETDVAALKESGSQKVNWWSDFFSTKEGRKKNVKFTSDEWISALKKESVWYTGSDTEIATMLGKLNKDNTKSGIEAINAVLLQREEDLNKPEILALKVAETRKKAIELRDKTNQMLSAPELDSTYIANFNTISSSSELGFFEKSAKLQQLRAERNATLASQRPELASYLQSLGARTDGSYTDYLLKGMQYSSINPLNWPTLLQGKLPARTLQETPAELMAQYELIKQKKMGTSTDVINTIFSGQGYTITDEQVKKIDEFKAREKEALDAQRKEEAMVGSKYLALKGQQTGLVYSGAQLAIIEELKTSKAKWLELKEKVKAETDDGIRAIWEEDLAQVEATLKRLTKSAAVLLIEKLPGFETMKNIPKGVIQAAEQFVPYINAGVTGNMDATATAIKQLSNTQLLKGVNAADLPDVGIKLKTVKEKYDELLAKSGLAKFDPKKTSEEWSKDHEVYFAIKARMDLEMQETVENIVTQGWAKIEPKLQKVKGVLQDMLKTKTMSIELGFTSTMADINIKALQETVNYLEASRPQNYAVKYAKGIDVTESTGRYLNVPYSYPDFRTGLTPSDYASTDKEGRLNLTDFGKASGAEIADTNKPYPGDPFGRTKYFPGPNDNFVQAELRTRHEGPTGYNTIIRNPDDISYNWRYAGSFTPYYQRGGVDSLKEYRISQQKSFETIQAELAKGEELANAKIRSAVETYGYELNTYSNLGKGIVPEEPVFDFFGKLPKKQLRQEVQAGLKSKQQLEYLGLSGVLEPGYAGPYQPGGPGSEFLPVALEAPKYQDITKPEKVQSELDRLIAATKEAKTPTEMLAGLKKMEESILLDRSKAISDVAIIQARIDAAATKKAELQPTLTSGLPITDPRMAAAIQANAELPNAQNLTAELADAKAKVIDFNTVVVDKITTARKNVFNAVADAQKEQLNTVYSALQKEVEMQVTAAKKIEEIRTYRAQIKSDAQNVMETFAKATGNWKEPSAGEKERKVATLGQDVETAMDNGKYEEAKRAYAKFKEIATKYANDDTIDKNTKTSIGDKFAGVTSRYDDQLAKEERRIKEEAEQYKQQLDPVIKARLAEVKQSLTGPDGAIKNLESMQGPEKEKYVANLEKYKALEKMSNMTAEDIGKMGSDERMKALFDTDRFDVKGFNKGVADFQEAIKSMVDRFTETTGKESTKEKAPADSTDKSMTRGNVEISFKDGAGDVLFAKFIEPKSDQKYISKSELTGVGG